MLSGAVRPQIKAPNGLSRLSALREMVGNTPLLAVRCRAAGRLRTVYAKAEFLNLSGSIKDRMALHILEDAHTHGRIRPGDCIVEATSGNSGIALAAIGRALGHPVVIYMPDWMSLERTALIRALGAQIKPVSHEQGGFLGSIRQTEDLARSRPDVFLPRQFSNSANISAHATTTGPEIAHQLEANGCVPSAFIAGVGTGGTVMGVGRYLKSRYPAIRVHPLEPSESPTLSTGCKVGKHRIQGVSDEFVPAIVDLSALEPIISVHDGDSILMAQKLAAELGLGVGISSGANFLGAMALQDTLGDDAVVVTIFCDDNKKYLSTDLMRHEPTRAGYRSPDIELLSYEALRRPGLSHDRRTMPVRSDDGLVAQGA